MYNEGRHIGTLLQSYENKSDNMFRIHRNLVELVTSTIAKLLLAVDTSCQESKHTHTYIMQIGTIYAATLIPLH